MNVRNPRAPRGPLEGLKDLAEVLGNDDEARSRSFIRGLTVGAIVGAMIAGSTIWQRRHRTPAKPAQAPEPGSTDAVPEESGRPA
jgi:hypothetical protein